MDQRRANGIRWGSREAAAVVFVGPLSSPRAATVRMRCDGERLPWRYRPARARVTRVFPVALALTVGCAGPVVAGGWQRQPVVSTGKLDGGSVAVDAPGVPWVAYLGDSLNLASRPGPAWQAERPTGLDCSSGANPQVAVPGENGKPVVAWIERST